MNSPSLIAIDTNSMPWEERFNEKIGRALYRKNLVEDAETGHGSTAGAVSCWRH